MNKDEQKNVRLIFLIVEQMKIDLQKIRNSSQNDAEYTKKLLLYLNKNPLKRDEYSAMVSDFSDGIVNVLKKNMR